METDTPRTGPDPVVREADARQEADTAPGRSVLLVLSANMLLDAIEVSLILVALPRIGDALGLAAPTVQWLMSGFALGFAALLLLGPAVNARLGRRRAYLGALLLFAAASVAGGLADSAALLIATRLVKGAAAALTAPAGLAIITTAYPAGPQRRRAVSVYSLFGAAGFTLGLLLSGLLLTAGWRWTFLLPAPLALLLLLFAHRVLPPDGPRPPAPRVAPALPLLRNGALLRAAVGAAVLNGSYQSLLLLAVFRTQRQLGWEPWQSALALLPACLPLALTAPFAGALTARWGTARPIAYGAALPLLGEALYLWRPGSGYPAGLLPPLLLLGAGLVLSFAALNVQAAEAVAPADRPAAVPLYQTAVQLGAVLMLPATAVLLGHGPRAAPAFVAAVGALGLLTALLGLRPLTDRSPHD